MYLQLEQAVGAKLLMSSEYHYSENVKRQREC